MASNKTAISSINWHKAIDTKGKIVNYDKWNGVLLFWGVKTCKCRTGGEYQPFKWCPPRSLRRGDNSHTRGFFELKVIIAVVLRSFFNSLTLNEGVHLDKINPFDPLLPSSQKHLSVGSSYLLPSLVFTNYSQRSNIMTTNNFETKTRSAVVFIDKYTTAGLSEIKAMCKENDLNDSCIIYNCTLHDTRPYRDIIKYITSQENPPAVIIDSNTCLYPQCIVSSSVLGTLEEMKLAEIYTYDQQLKTDENSIESQESEESQQKHPKLHLIKQPTFDLLTNATWQLKAVEAMCEEKQKQDKTKRGE